MGIDNLQDSLKRPFLAYDGDENYIFISYAHKDQELVFSEIEKFHDEGYPIWYDQGLTPGQEWDEEIEEALLDASLMVVFISKNSMASTNVVDEIKLALEEKIDIVPIYLEDAKLARGLRLRLSQKHAIFKYRMSENDYLYDCFRAFNKAKIPKIEFEKTPEPETENRTAPISGMPASYSGDEKYIYAGYAHADSARVFPQIQCFQDEMGYNVCFDDGLDFSNEWADAIVERIENSSLFVAFISNNFMDSEFSKRELLFAFNNDIPVVPIYLDDFEKIREDPMVEFLSTIQGIEINKMDKEECLFKINETFNYYGFESSKSFESQAGDDGTFKAYSGNQPYIFAAYSHKDSSRVIPDLARFKNHGYNVWYDEGIDPGRQWDEAIAEAMDCCSLFVIFISQNSMDSEFVLNELRYVRKRDIPIIPIYIEETELKGAFRFELMVLQSIFKYQLSDDEYMSLCTDTFSSFGLKVSGEPVRMDSKSKPDLEIPLDEIIFSKWTLYEYGNDYSKLSEEEHWNYEILAIKARAIANAAGGKICPKNAVDEKSAIKFDSVKDNYTIFKRAYDLFLVDVVNLGWSDGEYNYQRKTMPMSNPMNGTYSADREEMQMLEIIDTLKRAGYVFAKM